MLPAIELLWRYIWNLAFYDSSAVWLTMVVIYSLVKILLTFQKVGTSQHYGEDIISSHLKKQISHDLNVSVNICLSHAMLVQLLRPVAGVCQKSVLERIDVYSLPLVYFWNFVEQVHKNVKSGRSQHVFRYWINFSICSNKCMRGRRSEMRMVKWHRLSRKLSIK